MPYLSTFHAMAKPTGARCNLRCDYCYFLKKKSIYPNSVFRMSDDIMERYIRQTIGGQKAPEITIAWQGGEPTLMGIDFFRRAMTTEKKYTQPGMKIEHTIQTNGVLLDEEWCGFLSENKFLVGLSLDGPRALHDTFRKDRKGCSVFDNVVRAVRLMQKYSVDFNILCTVNATNSRHPLDVYRFFRDELGTQYLQFIPIVEREDASGGLWGNTLTDRSVQSEVYGEFLIRIFDEWVNRDVGSMFVQIFDGVLASYVLGYSSLCVLQAVCGQEIVVEHNGDVYSCDHYVEPDYLLGNIKHTSIGKLIRSEKQQRFGVSKSTTLPTDCKECEFLFTCYGECPKNRVLDAPDGSGKLNWLCAGLKSFFSHSKEPLKTMAELIRAGRHAEEIMGARCQRGVGSI